MRRDERSAETTRHRPRPETRHESASAPLASRTPQTKNSGCFRIRRFRIEVGKTAPGDYPGRGDGRTGRTPRNCSRQRSVGGQSSQGAAPGCIACGPQPYTGPHMQPNWDDRAAGPGHRPVRRAADFPTGPARRATAPCDPRDQPSIKSMFTCRWNDSSSEMVVSVVAMP